MTEPGERFCADLPDPLSRSGVGKYSMRLHSARYRSRRSVGGVKRPLGREGGWPLRDHYFRDVTLSILTAVALVVIVRVVVLAVAAYPATIRAVVDAWDPSRAVAA